jgi:D-alanyl-D-alanine carboxypeptidase (penicillin-binding protein 5/6)
MAAVMVFALFSLGGSASAEGMTISARAAVVMDAETGEVIIAKDMDRKLPPASTTKVMTAILALENARMDDWFRVSKRAASMQPTKINLRAGDKVTVEALMYALLLKSANDAAATLAENIAGSEARFAAMMTDKAREIGAVNTRFKTASGLPAEDQYTTAYDLALILRQATQDQSFMDIAGTRFATLHMGEKHDLSLKNSNKLLWLYEGAIAGKTGYTRRAHTCYVGAVDCDGRRLIVSLLGSDKRWEDVTKLLDRGFELAASGDRLVLAGSPDKVKAAKKRGKHTRKSRKASGKSRKSKRSGTL